MTPDAQIAAMAKLDGAGEHEWSEGFPEQIGFIPQCNVCCIAVGESGSDQLCSLKLIPDYLQDRNATLAVAMKLTVAQRKAMRAFLWEMMDQMSAHLPTAAQETEAILRACGLWTP